VARIRSLKPSFFKNEDLARLSFAHRLLYEGLWCWADRDGRLEDRPTRLKAEIFPYDELDVESLLSDLDKAGFIRRYVVGRMNVIAIPRFLKHQFPRNDERSNNLPAPPKAPDPPKKPSRSRNGTAAVPLLPSEQSTTPPHVGSREYGVGSRERTAAAPQRRPEADPDPDDHYAVVTAVVTKDILPLRLEDHELMAATLNRCEALHIACTEDVARKAIDSALFRYYRALRLEADLPSDPRGIYHDHVRPKAAQPVKA
jgi:hypothetical protein